MSVRLPVISAKVYSGNRPLRRCRVFLQALVAILVLASSAWGYGPFNHLCVVDRNWGSLYKQIQAVGPLSEDRAVDAVFAGAIADDLGYYHLGNPALKELTNQTHYIRPGEWVDFLLRRARNSGSSSAVDYAFALGVLSHYAVDRMGHYYGTNVVAVGLAHKQQLFGPRMSYERDPSMHTAVEAGFDFLSVQTDCRADQLSDRFYGFLRESGWPDGEHVFGFLAGALRRFYGYSPVERVADLVHAVIFARRYTIRLLKEEGGPYALDRLFANHSTSSEAKPDFYATLTPSESADEDHWIEEQLKTGKQLSVVETASGFLRLFANSFARAQELLLALLTSAEQLRQRQDDEVKSGAVLEIDKQSFPNINLDTDQISLSGRYDLADCTAEYLAERSNGAGNNASASPSFAPPATGELAPFFEAGHHARTTLSAPASSDRAVLRTQLQNIADAIKHEHDRTQNELTLDPSWDQVDFRHQSFLAGTCPGTPAASPFGTHANICIAPKVVYWKDKVRPLTLLFAASAAARPQNTPSGRNEIEEELSHEREAIESFRLCDTNKTRGYFDAGSCSRGERKHGSPDPTGACVNQD
jgi:Zinc dependent phospholipase C